MKKIVIETLYPEFNNLYGDRGNVLYLKKKLEKSGCEVSVIQTGLFDIPNFINSKTDFLYIGPCQEKQQLIELERLKEIKPALEERINGGAVTFASGNAFELFGEYIELPGGEKTEALGFFPYHAERFSRLRYNDCSVGEFGDMLVTGFKNLLSFSYGELPEPFLKMKKGAGMNKKCGFEGVCKNNFFATYHTGPLLALNPQFSEYIIKLIDSEIEVLPLSYEKQAYEKRIKELL